MVPSESAMPELHDPEMDDGATEVVAASPLRKGAAPVETQKVARTRAGGRVRDLTAAGEKHRRDFITIRRAGALPVRITLPHLPVFKGLWEVWQSKRTAAEPDPGVAIAEISERLVEHGAPLATSSIASSLRSLLRSNVVRCIDGHVGWRGRRTRYYPTSAGIEAFALAEVLGEGTLVQVGRTGRSWRQRDESEPKNLFQHAALLRAWAGPLDPTETA